MAGVCDLDVLCSLLDEDEIIEEGAGEITNTTPCPDRDRINIKNSANNDKIKNSRSNDNQCTGENEAGTPAVNVSGKKSPKIEKNKLASSIGRNNGHKINSVKKNDKKECTVNSAPTYNNANPTIVNNVSNIEAIQAELKAMNERMMLLQQQLEAQQQENVKKLVQVKVNSPPAQKTLKDVSLPWMESDTTIKRNQPPKPKPSNVAPKQPSPKITPVAPKQPSPKITPAPKQRGNETSYINDDLSSSEEEAERYPLENRGLNEFGKEVKKRLSHQPKYDTTEFKQKQTWVTQKKSSLTQSTIPDTLPTMEKNGDSSNGNIQTEFFSGLRIVNPTISSAVMKEKMSGKKMIRLSVMQQYMRGGDIEGDWVTIGVIISKSEPRTSANGKNYTIWRLSDLRDCSQTISFFLFGKVHQQHWKTPVGTVTGLLNPSIMPSRDSNAAGGKEVSLTVDHPQKVMLMGKSKDLGTCRGKRKDGSGCTMIVNVDVCEYCQFHIQSAYKKVSSKRMDLQSSFSGPEPKGLRKKILKNQEVFYGGQSFTSNISANNNTNKKRSSSSKKLILDSLKLQKQAELVKQEALLTPSLNSGKNSASIAPITSTALEDMLAIPSAGSRNLVKHLTQEIEDEKNKGKANVCSITAKDLLKLHAKEVKARQAIATNTKQAPAKIGLAVPKLSVPMLGSGIGEGQDILFDSVPAKRRVMSPGKIKKVRAVAKVNKAGPLKKINPNAVKKVKSPEMVQRVKKRLKNSGVVELDDDDEAEAKRVRVNEEKIDFEKHKDIINRKSMYADLLTVEQMEKQELYFNALEKKENMETYMSGIMEIPCNVVSCKKCQYTAFSASERCREEGHPLNYHKGKKRFFSCKRCKRRTISLDKLPTHACKNCGDSSYERVGMWKEKSGPKLASEILSLRGDEIKNLTCVEAKNINLNL